jgi:hypothetical protein
MTVISNLDHLNLNDFPYAFGCGVVGGWGVLSQELTSQNLVFL